MNKDFNKRLAQMQESWDQGKKEYDKMFGVCDVPASEYDFQLISAELTEVGDYVAIKIEQNVISEGPNEGTPVITLKFLGNKPQQMAFVRRWFELLGYECPDDLTDMAETLEEITTDEPQFKGKLSFYQDRPQIDVIEVYGNDPGKPEEPNTKEEPEKSGEEDELITQMFTFCATYGIDVEEGMGYDELREKISELEYEAENVDEEERKLLEDIGLEECIKEPPKPKPKPTKTATKKPVKKSGGKRR